MARKPDSLLSGPEMWTLLLVVALGLFLVGYAERSPAATLAGLALGSVLLAWASFALNDGEG